MLGELIGSLYEVTIGSGYSSNVAYVSQEDAKLRRKHKNNHPFEGSTLIDRMVSPNHPGSKGEYIYSITLRRCTCGVIFEDKGLSTRRKGE